MKRQILLTVFLIIILISACHIFLGPDPENSPKEIFNSLWKDFDETYALFNEREINWNEIKNKYYPQISSDMSNIALFRVCANMLNELNDPHVYLAAPFYDSNLLKPAIEESELLNLKVVQNNYLSDGGQYAGDGRFLYGTFTSNPDIGYIYIQNFFDNFSTGLKITQDWSKDIDTIMKNLGSSSSLILDIRDNEGGIGSNVHFIASHFFSNPETYIYVSTKNGPGHNDFSKFYPVTIEPAKFTYTKPIVLLTNSGTISAGEWFAKALLTQNHVIHAGSTTRGAFSPRIIRYLINGWKYTISIQNVAGINGEQLEGIGIVPDPEHIIYNTKENFEKEIDTQLEYSLSLLKL